MDPRLVNDIEQFLATCEPHVTTAATLSEELGQSKHDVLQALRILEYEGVSASVRTGARALAWWHVERVRPPLQSTAADRDTDDSLTPDEDDDPDTESRVEADGALEAVDEADADAPPEEPHPESWLPEPDGEMYDILAGIDIPGQRNDVVEDRRRAVATCLNFLRDEARASKDDFKHYILSRDDVDHHYVDSESAWTNLVYPALKALAPEDDRLTRATTHDPWEWDEHLD